MLMIIAVLLTRGEKKAQTNMTAGRINSCRREATERGNIEHTQQCMLEAVQLENRGS